MSTCVAYVQLKCECDTGFDDTEANPIKTFYDRNLRIFVISNKQ
jgi:hypothetical protein